MGNGNHAGAVAEANRATAPRVAAVTRPLRAVRSARTSKAGGKASAGPAHLSQPIRSAEEAKAWLEQHAGVRVADVNNHYSTHWDGPGYRGSDHEIMLNNWSGGIKGQVLGAAKATQAYMRAHPAGSPGEYQTTHEGLRRVVEGNARALVTGAKDPTTRAAAKTLLAALQRANDLNFGVAHQFFQPQRPAEDGGPKTPETKAEEAQRFARELEALRLLRDGQVNPQLALTPHAEASLANALSAGEATYHEAQRAAEHRATALGEAKATIAHDAAAYARIPRAELHARGLEGVAAGTIKIAQQFARGDDHMPRPSRPAAKETEEQRLSRLEKDMTAERLWHDALTRRPADLQRSYGSRFDMAQITHSEARQDTRTYRPLQDELNGLRVVAEIRAERAAAARATDHPFVTALKEGKSVLLRAPDGGLRLYTGRGYSPDTAHPMLDRIHYRSQTPEEALRPQNDNWQSRLGITSHDSPGKLMQRFEANGYKVEGVYDSRAKAVNVLKAQPATLGKLFEQARARHASLTSQLADEKRYVAAFEARNSTDNIGYRNTVARAAQLVKQVETARRSVAALERKMEQAGLRPKAPRAKKASKSA